MGLKVLHDEFISCLSANKQGPEQMLLWKARHAFSGYMDSCNAMIRSMLGPLELGLEKVRGLDIDHPSAKRDGVLVTLHWKFTLELVSFRSWSQIYQTVLPPYHYVMTFLDNTDDLNEARRMFQRMATAIMDLEKFVKENPGNKLTRALLTDVATHHWVVTRECIILGKSCEWDLTNFDFVEQCLAMFAGGNNTKYTLESAFNHLKDSLRQARISGSMVWWQETTLRGLLPKPEIIFRGAH